MISKNALQRLEQKHPWIGIVFFLDLIGGLALTMKYMFSRTVTMQYPDKEKWMPYPRYRGHHVLRRDENGENKCVACELCSKICPTNCITVVPHENEQGKRRPLVYEVNLARCLFCGLCEDACPEEAIALGSTFEYAAYRSQDLQVGCDELLNAKGKTEQGGCVVSAQFFPDDNARVEAKEKAGYHWWRNIHRQKDKIESSVQGKDR
ncbi:MAG: NADH-quinone oxidoreductase subunit NuoI [Oceanicoccus sp.]|uniref:NADH-quinone oxidoreductase subunit NuoI n=1 Tax=Oceanicoccus sp. TaxID=2691044 RepID=UPI00260956C4|nr:NADH-quinone oxidoreductase subunit NuoI [Oceanicoccus sp.]MCP3907777.1 NADH-quinone oxidoreductase subunit NuoI [Oceanicoccus sp.]